jgi:hypothetical protein
MLASGVMHSGMFVFKAGISHFNQRRPCTSARLMYLITGYLDCTINHYFFVPLCLGVALFLAIVAKLVPVCPDW